MLTLLSHRGPWAGRMDGNSMKVYIVIGQYDYEGSLILFVASTKESAEAWRDKYFQQENRGTMKEPYIKWVAKPSSGWFGEFDAFDIEVWDVDVDEALPNGGKTRL